MDHVHGHTYEEEFITNSRGVQQFTCRWSPADTEPRALVFLCHGYASECSINMKGVGARLAQAGYATYGIDYEGHGKSAGLQAYVPSFDALVGDCAEFFASICEREENAKKGRFLWGESMGGAVAIQLHRRMPSFWTGAVLVAPMCKLDEKVRPHPVVVNVLMKLANVIPTWKIIPGKDLTDHTYRCPDKRSEIRANAYCYKGTPRLKTGCELLMITMEIQKNLHQVSLPFLLLHGEDDRIIDASISKQLYESSSSVDKTLMLYPGMWHNLTYGELPENVDRVFRDAFQWLHQRSGPAAI